LSGLLREASEAAVCLVSSFSTSHNHFRTSLR
jgi:hypothetical protein